jgi:hypothetical protein
LKHAVALASDVEEVRESNRCEEVEAPSARLHPGCRHRGSADQDDDRDYEEDDPVASIPVEVIEMTALPIQRKREEEVSSSE